MFCSFLASTYCGLKARGLSNSSACDDDEDPVSVTRRRSPGCVTPYWNDTQLNSMTLRSELTRATSQLNSKSVREDDTARWPNSIHAGGVAQEVHLIPVSSSESGVVCGGEEENDENVFVMLRSVLWNML